MQAVRISALYYLQGRLYENFDLAVAAFGSENEGRKVAEKWLDLWCDWQVVQLNSLIGVLSDATKKINEHEGFVAGLLCGMSDHAGVDCHLRILAKGKDFSLALKQMVASFLGIPIGKELGTLRRAVENLSIVYQELWVE